MCWHSAKCFRCHLVWVSSSRSHSKYRAELGREVKFITCSHGPHGLPPLQRERATLLELLEKLLERAGSTIRNQDHQRKHSCLKDVSLFQARALTSAEQPQGPQTSPRGTKKPLENSSLNLRAPVLPCEPCKVLRLRPTVWPRGVGLFMALYSYLLLPDKSPQSLAT